MVTETKVKPKTQARTTIETLLRKAQKFREADSLTNREAVKRALRWIGAMPKSMSDELLETGAMYCLESLDARSRSAVRNGRSNSHNSPLPALGDPSSHLAIQNQAKAEAGYRATIAEFPLANADGIVIAFGRFSIADLNAYANKARAQAAGCVQNADIIEAFVEPMEEHDAETVEELPNNVLAELVPGLQNVKDL